VLTTLVSTLESELGEEKRLLRFSHLRLMSMHKHHEDVPILVEIL
jgi:hypothetical protein